MKHYKTDSLLVINNNYEWCDGGSGFGELKKIMKV
jgi:hypothetical protein